MCKHHDVELSSRFWEKVNKTDTCWLWTRSTNRKGYGKFSLPKSNGWILSHIASYVSHTGCVPEGMFVLHTCDIKACVNPEHLYAGTFLQNMRDRAERGTEWKPGVKGVKTMETANAIRQDVANGMMQKDAAVKYGLHPATIMKIVHYKSWKK
jgi:hypothetical protein